jgi:hypothetical protein
VARPTFQTWQVICFRRGKRDISKVAREMFQRWQERHFRGGKRDILKVSRPTGRGIISDVVDMGETLLDVARTTSIRWKQRWSGVTSSGVVAMGATILEVERETSWTWQ